jgi:hypothetical protein
MNIISTEDKFPTRDDSWQKSIQIQYTKTDQQTTQYKV